MPRRVYLHESRCALSLALDPEVAAELVRLTPRLISGMVGPRLHSLLLSAPLPAALGSTPRGS